MFDEWKGRGFQTMNEMEEEEEEEKQAHEKKSRKRRKSRKSRKKKKKRRKCRKGKREKEETTGNAEKREELRLRRRLQLTVTKAVQVAAAEEAYQRSQRRLRVKSRIAEERRNRSEKYQPWALDRHGRNLHEEKVASIRVVEELDRVEVAEDGESWWVATSQSSILWGISFRHARIRSGR